MSKNLHFKILSLGFLIFVSTFSICAQQSADDDEDLIKPARPGVANPAEFQPPGVLQIEFGYDANFRADQFRQRQSAPLDLRFAPVSRLLLETEIETVTEQREEEFGTRTTGVGDVRVGFQVLALKEKTARPAIAFAYQIKLPTASEDKQLGSGRYDHRLAALFSKKLDEKTDLDVTLAYLNDGRDDSRRRADGGQAAISLSHDLTDKFGFEVELNGQSLEAAAPKGANALGAITYKVNKRLRFDAGVSVGLSNEAPRFGVFAGFTAGVGNPLKKR